ncbi:hypothetical protein [Nocardioides sp. CER19]|uniref:hypothetical protein n=1 Tax=Nocardioides sp. CER19 TaxID=3038538 RepID=UPI002449CEBF|nr:hypothetical protein [Nocardioides sp. CER19]MDH2414851.1 hypothetical protein [Nocardioides sp. CER19]
MRRVTLLTVPVLALALSACGGDPGPRPGTALQIDGMRVTTTHVHDVATEYCDAVAKTGSSASAQTVQNEVVSALAARLVAERYAEIRGVQPDASYKTQVNQLRQQLGDFDQATQDAVVEVGGAQAYVSSVISQTGEQAFTQWLDEQHVAINPVYGLTLHGGQFTHVDSSLSLATSSQAKTAVKAAADPSAAPAEGSRSCG